MNISSELISFKNEVAPYIGDMEASMQNLSADVVLFKSTNDSVNSQLTGSFKGVGGDAITPEVEYMNQTIAKVQESIESELSTAITKANELSAGIAELESIINEYNSAQSEYDAASRDYNSASEEDNSARSNASARMSSAKSKMESAKRTFESKHSTLIAKHKELLNLDSSLSILQQFGIEDPSVDMTGFTAKYDGDVQFSSIYYELDGVIYQKIVPICKGNVPYVPDEQYTIVYNKANLLAADANAGSQAIAFLNSKLQGNTEQYLWNYSTKRYDSTASSAIAKVMDCILKDTYKANNASTIVDYAALSAMVATNSLVHLGYGSNPSEKTEGFSKVLTSGGDLDCIGFVRWCYTQGIAQTNSTNGMFEGASMTPLNLLNNHSVSLASMSTSDKANIEIGSVLSMPTTNNYHVGIVIGHTTTESGEPAVIVAQSSSKKLGANNRVYTLSELGKSGKWTNVSTPTMMTTRVTRGSNSSTYVS